MTFNLRKVEGFLHIRKANAFDLFLKPIKYFGFWYIIRYTPVATYT